MGKTMKKKTPVKTAKRRGGVPAFTKRDLVLKIARDTTLTQESVHAVIQDTIETVADVLLEGRAIEFRDFGVFEPVMRKARIGRNPKKPTETVKIPDRRTVKFRPGRAFKARLEGKKL